MKVLRVLLSRVKSSRGFSLIEVLVAAVVLVVGLIMVAQFFTSAGTRVLESDIRSVLHQVATKEMEAIRGLPYEDVGIEGSAVAPGVLSAEDTVEVDGVLIKIERDVAFHTDETYDGPYPANYRRVVLSATAVDEEGERLGGLAPVELVSYVAGGATGGAILVKVQNAAGEPVEGAHFTIVNSPLGVFFDAVNQVTDEAGTMLVPGLTPDADGNYVVTATKTNYSTDSDTGFPVLEAGLQEVILTIDQLSSMNIRVVDQSTGLDLSGISVEISGPGEYESTVVTGASGVLVTGLRYSTESEPYIVSVPEGQGYVPEQTSVVLAPGTTGQEVLLEVVAGGSTTTTVSVSTTTTTVAGTTTTVLGTGSLRVTVLNSSGQRLMTRAVVQLGTVSKSSRTNIVLFEGLQLDTYTLFVSAPFYADHTESVTITGANSITVYMEWEGW